jgi:hypothetical protein
MCVHANLNLRSELESLPLRMRKLPVDERGYPVPWFVAWQDGKPEFRAMDGEKWRDAIRFKLCWVCGERLGVYKTFVAGPMCGINRTSAEPPCHLECAQWSARNCPFLRNPQQGRRDMEDVSLSESAPGFCLERNPGVALLWTTKTYSLFDDGRGKALITFGEPESMEWIAEGRPATRQEILRSIEAGLPALMALAQTQEGAVKHLLETRDKFISQYVEKVA